MTNISDKAKLTNRGYSIDKKYLTPEIIKQIKSDLTVAPTNDLYDANSGDVASFKLYVNKENKIIMPRFYGVKKFGVPSRDTYTPKPIDVPFHGELREFQIELVDKTLTHLHKHGGGLLSVGTGVGKCLAPGTMILLHNGHTKPVEDIIVGDKLMGDDMKPRNVLSVTNGYANMYRVYNDNTDYCVNSSHILSLYNIRTRDIEDIAITDYINMSADMKSEYRGIRKQASYSYKFTAQLRDPVAYAKQLYNNPGPIRADYKYNSVILRKRLIIELIKLYGNTIQVDNRDYINDIKFVTQSVGWYARKVNDSEVVIKRDDDMIYDINIDDIGYGQYYGFEIDGNRRFLLDDFTVTHNTFMAIYVAHKLGVKTLVVVHKEFLMTQWANEIKLQTGSSVGFIQQNKIETDHNFSIAMIHSLAMKDYDNDIFNDYGLVIYDECHHIAAKIFSKALYKSSMKYVLALSATPNRKDGLTKIINWYVGDVIYKQKRRLNDLVVAKVFNYTSTSPLFKEVKQWVAGEMRPSYVKMVGNILQIESRNSLIVETIRHIMTNNKRVLLILSDRIEHLTTLKESYDSTKPANIITSFYIGGMKEAERKHAEHNAHVMFGTYNMAAEGLNIPRLNSLILGSPKKDVVQAVGRIMRKILEDGDERPLIIDFADMLSCFAKHSEIREKEYGHSKYTVENYYAINDKIVTYDKYLRDVDKRDNEQIEIIRRYHPESFYDPTFDKVMEMKLVDMTKPANNNDSDSDNDDNEPTKPAKGGKTMKRQTKQVAHVVNYDDYQFDE